MKYIFIDTYYNDFLDDFYRSCPTSYKLSYEQHKNKILSESFGTSDFYSYYLNKIGEEAIDIIANDEVLQKKWAKENDVKFNDNWIISKLQSLPYVYRFLGKPKWIQEIALAQIKKYQPDIVYMQDLSILNTETLKEVKKYCKLLVGQIASPAPPKKYLKQFDLIITSFPHFVDKFRKLGIKSEYQKLAFEPRVLKMVGKQKRIYDVTFVGSFTPYHSEGTKVLEEVAKHVPVHVWGQGIEFLSPFSPLRKNYHGQAWGLQMYKILAQSKIIINRHISVSDDYANNMRLYEATGMGAMLITDKKKNLNEIFDVNEEIVDYKDANELINKLNYYLKNDQERKKIARFGQRRTLRDHVYLVEIKNLERIIKENEI